VTRLEGIARRLLQVNCTRSEGSKTNFQFDTHEDKFLKDVFLSAYSLVKDPRFSNLRLEILLLGSFKFLIQSFRFCTYLLHFSAL